MSALNACAAKAIARSTPWTSNQRAVHDRANWIAAAIIAANVRPPGVSQAHPRRVNAATLTPAG